MLLPFFAKATAVMAVVAAIGLTRYRAHHPHGRFGPANLVTALRAVLVAGVVASIGEPATTTVALLAVGLAAIATAMDGLDGWLARRTRLESAFGARFDTEVDALLILALSVLAWRHGKAGAWVMASGLMRYAFVAAGAIWAWLRAPLTPTTRGKTVCVVQIAGLLIVLLPGVEPPLSTAIASASLAALTTSFAIDVGRLWEQRLRG